MTGNTLLYGLPYPTATDPVANGDDTIQALASRVELVLSSGDVAPGFMGPAVNLAASATGALGSILIPQTYKAKTLYIALLYTPAAATAGNLTLLPDFPDDPRLGDHGWVHRQPTINSAVQACMYFQIPVGVGASATTTFTATASSAVGQNSVRAYAWVR